MKKILIPILMSLCSAFFANAQDIDKLPAITVTGTAEIRIAPDEVILSLDVTKNNKDLQVAKRQNDESVGKILELARSFSVLPQNVQTTYISVEMKYDSIRDAKTRIFNDDGEEIGKRIFKGYEVSKTVNVRLTDISKFEEFFSRVLDTGITEVNEVKFETSKLRENKDTAREMAMKAAKEKATAMAAALGQTIGKAIKIVEQNAGSQSFTNLSVRANTMSMVGSFSENLASFSPGVIKVEAQVTVSFQLN